MLMFDIEANGLLDYGPDQATKIHCGAWQYYSDDTIHAGTATDLVNAINQATTICGHNILRYDLPLLLRLGLINPYVLNGNTMVDLVTGKTTTVVDTLILSRLLYGGEVGGVPFEHGLAAWGNRLGLIKPEVTDWVEGSLDLYIYRCKQDVIITTALAKMLSINWASIKQAHSNECHFADTITRQVQTGVSFDKGLAEQAVVTITERMQYLENSILHLLPNTSLTKGELKLNKLPSKRFNTDGSVNGMFINWLTHRALTLSPEGKVLDASLNQVADIAIDEYVSTTKQLKLANDAGMKTWLLANGWEPEFYNTKDIGNKRINTTPRIRVGETICPNLLRLMSANDNVGPVVKAYLAYSTYHNRVSVLNGMLANPRLAVDGKLSADMTTLGTTTGRVAHKTVANIPKKLNMFDDALNDYKNAMRKCFIAPPGWKLVGIDWVALEARVEAHFVQPYPGSADYIKQLLAEKPDDLHTINAAVFNTSRDTAKAVKYGLGYGASVKKLAVMLRSDLKRAQEIYDKFWERAACLKLFRDDTKTEWLASNKEYIYCIDGSKLFTNKEHVLVNYKFQSTGTKLSKMGACLIDEYIYLNHLQDYIKKVIDYHDEYQFLVSDRSPISADDLGKEATKLISKAGVVMGMRVPFLGDYKVGLDWASTH